MTIPEFQSKKRLGQRITMVTCYDFTMAQILNASQVDALLVGDSAAMVVHGHPTTIAADNFMMAYHAAAVSRGAPSKLIVGDMPFLSFRKGLPAAMECVDQLMKAGVHAVKLEGLEGHEEIVENIVKSGVPVMGHLGLTPQSIHSLGGFKVQGKGSKARQKLLESALKLEDLGCFSIVLECVPELAAKEISQRLTIPTIGIGAGIHCDGQILVIQDLLGMNKNFQPRFVRKYLDGFELVQEAVNQYVSDVKELRFPLEKESYPDEGDQKPRGMATDTQR